MDKAKLEALLERVEAATGPDREIDHLIHDAVVEPIGARLYNPKDRGGSFIAADVLAPAYTASIDAALALVERVLPGWAYQIVSPRKDRGFEGVVIRHQPHTVWCAYHTASAPLAIIAALLRALIAKESTQ